MTSQAVIHPDFIKCNEFTLDNYWRETFMSCAYNKFPKGARYEGSTRNLYIGAPMGRGGRAKTQVFDLPEDPKTMYTVLMDVFREKLGLFSPTDLRIKREELDQIHILHRESLDCEWKKLKPQYLKDIAIMNYVTKMAGQYSLTKKDMRRLINTISLG